MARMKEPPAAIARRMAEKPQKVSEDKLEKLKTIARAARDLAIRIANGTALLETLGRDYTTITRETLPEYMDRVRVPSIEIGREYDKERKRWLPAFEVQNKPFYQANIAADWPADKRAESFDYLKEIGHDDLIKTIVEFQFPRGVTMHQIDQFCKLAQKIGVGSGKSKVEIPEPSISRSIPWSSLTAWLRNQVEVQKFVPKLDKIGGFVGKVAKPVFLEDE